MSSAGPTERRVRAALLRLWELDEGEAYSWSSSEVQAEVNSPRCEGHGGRKGIDAIQEVGRRVARGQGFACTPSGWSELDDGVEYTYSRGLFTVRKRAEPVTVEANAPPTTIEDIPRLLRERHAAGESIHCLARELGWQDGDVARLVVSASDGWRDEAVTARNVPDAPNSGVVATGVSGDPSVQRSVREGIGHVLCSARHLDGDNIVVHMDALESMAHSILVDFEFPDSEASPLVPLPLHVDDVGRELTEDELATLPDGEGVYVEPSGDDRPRSGVPLATNLLDPDWEKKL